MTKTGKFQVKDEPTDALERMPQMEAEHAAWLDMVKEFKALDYEPAVRDHGFDINATLYSPLVQSIRLWAEHLVALRIKQTDKERTKAMAFAETALKLAKE